MRNAIDSAELARMFQAAAGRLRDRHALLSQLDAAAGDGDHGATMLRAAARLQDAVKRNDARDWKAIFRDLGWNLHDIDGGASGALLGTFFSGMAEAGPIAGAGPAGASLDIRTLAAMFEAGLAALGNQTPAQPGDKTMMDALVPAVRAFTVAANSNQTVAEALHAASGAARAGAEATRDLVARYGRARHLGEKTRGHQDPGATSIGLIFEGLDRALTEPPISGEDHDG